MDINKKFIIAISFVSLGLFLSAYDFCFAAVQQPPQAQPTVINYTYDPSGQRITVSNGTKTTIYPTKNYNTDGTTITKHVFANGTDTATINGSGAAATIHYTTTDNLGSSSLITNQSGNQEELIDYYPFGGIRLDQKTGTFNEQRKYIGQEYDADTGLNYLNARYYNAVLGRFISEDSMFWNFDKAWLADPQNQNSYAYARNNPIVLSDPSGFIPTKEEAALMANQIYQNGKEGENLSGGWQYINSLTQNGTGMKMGVYSRTQDDTQCVPLEYALVSRGTRGLNPSDWGNNFGQPFGLSSDVRASITQAKDFTDHYSGNEVTFVGQSKGAPEAEAGAVKTNKNAILFNPAAANLSAYGLDYSAYKGQISTYIVSGEIINNTEGLVIKPAGNVTYLPTQHSLSPLGRFLLGPVSSVIDVYNSVQNHYMSSVISALKGQ